MEQYVSLWAVVALALVHLFGTRLRFLAGVPRSTWLSAASGVSVAYVLLHLFPELDAGQEHVQHKVFLRHHVYLMALVGLAVFYGLERIAVTSRKENKPQHEEHKPPPGVFWLLVAALVTGWATGCLLELRESVIILLMAFVGGGVELNVLKEELPEERESRYWAFLLGAGLYAVLLLTL